MIREYLNNKLQTNLGHREEEPHNNQDTSEDKQNKATSSLSLSCPTR